METLIWGIVQFLLCSYIVYEGFHRITILSADFCTKIRLGVYLQVLLAIISVMKLGMFQIPSIMETLLLMSISWGLWVNHKKWRGDISGWLPKDDGKQTETGAA